MSPFDLPTSTRDKKEERIDWGTTKEVCVNILHFNPNANITHHTGMPRKSQQCLGVCKNSEGVKVICEEGKQ